MQIKIGFSCAAKCQDGSTCMNRVRKQGAMCGRHRELLQSRLRNLQSRIEYVNPLCEWSNALIVSLETEAARVRYRELTRKALEIERQLGW
jgi:hypothetical protein